MKERPILFSGSMVRALLAGTKTQTRRVVKLKPWHQIEERDDGSPWPWMHDNDRDADHWLPCPFGQPRERLWVREAWAQGWTYGGERPCTLYRATGDGLQGGADYPRSFDPQLGASAPSGMKWKPSIHMPRWASRITLEITDVRVERLQDISEADAIAEGARLQDVPYSGEPYNRWSMESAARSGQCLSTARMAFANYIDKINGQECWDANPWVWVVSFKQI